MPAGRGTPPDPGQAMLREAIAQKVLLGWAENRQQVAVPLAVNLGRMPPAEAGLVVQAMAAALALAGPPSEAARQRLGAALARAGGAGLPVPERPDLLALFAALEGAGLGPHAYAASLMVLDRREKLARAWLDLLAARFALPAELLAGLARRYRG
ncbi:hypothetical protein [Falsiroseomonas sp. CW058]|uniref:hypothetical protein n=1 Tax=Falsiroseomonas sp. CW058 TaxID=3388664 RepID=UPI003D310C3C